MKMLHRAALALLALLACAPAMAQTKSQPDVDAGSPAGFAPVSSDMPLRRSVALTVGGGQASVGGSLILGRNLITTCTAAGNVTIVHNDGSTVTVYAQVGTSYWPDATREIAAGSNAACSYWNAW